MKTFNKSINTDTTRVQIKGIKGWNRVKEINASRNLIKIHGYEGSFQIGHVERYTNKLVKLYGKFKIGTLKEETIYVIKREDKQEFIDYHEVNNGIYCFDKTESLFDDFQFTNVSGIAITRVRKELNNDEVGIIAQNCKNLKRMYKYID